MTYSVPAHGEPNWDGKVNPSLQYLKDTAEAAETPTGAQAKATAAYNAAAADSTNKANAVQANLDAHSGNTSNPHAVTKSQVGLGNVDNTSDASKPISTAQQTAFDARLQITEAPLSASRYGVKGDGSTDDAAALNAALTAAGGASNGEVYISRQASFIKVGSTITIPSGVRLFGSKLTEIRGTGTADTITFASGGNQQRLDGVYATAVGGGHVLAIPNSSEFRISDSLLVQWNTAKSCVYHDGTGTFIDATFDRCAFNAAAGATVSPIHLQNPGNNLQGTRWRDCRFNGSATMTAPFVRVLNTASSGGVYLNNHTFRDITAEVCPAGIIHASSVNGLTIDHVAPWDVSGNYTDDIFKVYTQSGGVPSRNVEVRHSGRRGGGLTAGKYDVNFSTDSTECVASFMAPMHLPNTPATIQLGTVNCLKIACGGGQIGGTFLESSYSGMFKLGYPSTADRPLASTVGPGAVMFNSTTNKPNFSDGTTWRDALGYDIATPSTAWTSYTPTVSGSGSALGNGTVTGAYAQHVDGTVHFYAQFTLGTTSTVGTAFSLSLPVTASSAFSFSALDAVGVDQGVAFYSLAAWGSTTSAQAYVRGTNGNLSPVATSAPFAWGSTDIITIRGTYRAA